MKTGGRRWVLALVGLAAVSCDGGRSGRGAAAIVGGEDSTAEDDAVVLILTHVPEKDTPGGQFYQNCSGTMLSDRVVLTARHCVSATTSGGFTCDMTGKRTGGTGGIIKDDFVPANTSVYVGPKLPDSLDPAAFPGHAASYVRDEAAQVLCNADVALIVLDAPIEGVKIAPIRLEGDVTKGEAIYAVGWGATETSFVPSSRQRRDGVSIVDVGPSAEMYPMGQLSEKEFLATESVCFGDSGGPAFDAATKAVVGVVSRGPYTGDMSTGAGCVGTEHTFMKTTGFVDLVHEAFALAGGQPWLEGQPPPTSDGGGGAGGGGGATAGEGGTGGAAMSSTGDDDTGCSAAAGRARGGLGALTLVALALAGARRSRRRAPRLSFP